MRSETESRTEPERPTQPKGLGDGLLEAMRKDAQNRPPIVWEPGEIWEQGAEEEPPTPPAR